eukprot:TRINITY_DN8_c0_g5_i1.p1 TRINITY_DN8_c0_g5~~TRINITY_DN8_c0_g5_i1.p1  ORF type:complete len:528 (+),score=72.49 TRINITY_DN8_c0_g5_i1:64-1647(+)
MATNAELLAMVAKLQEDLNTVKTDHDESLDTIWMLLAAMLVFFMHAGFSLLEAGCVRFKNTQNIMAKNLLVICIGFLCWYSIGWALAYGTPDTPNKVIGTTQFFAQGFLEDKTLYASLTWEHFPCYPWAYEDSSEDAFHLRFSEVKQDVDMRRAQSSAEWVFGDYLIAPLLWYMSQMRVNVGHDDACLGISWLELMLDFTASTLIVPLPPRLGDSVKAVPLQTAYGHFSAAWRRAAAVSNAKLALDIEPCRSTPSALALGLPAPLPGLSKRLKLLSPGHTHANLLNICRSGRMTSIKDLPSLDVAVPGMPLWGVPSQVTHVKRREAGNTTVKKTTLDAVEWSNAEKEVLARYSNFHDVWRTKKILLHNRGAASQERHEVALPAAGAATDARLGCMRCPAVSKLSFLSIYMTEKCSQVQTTKSASGVRRWKGRLETIALHNAVSTTTGKHHIAPLGVDDIKVACLRCREMVPINDKHAIAFKDFTKEKCLALVPDPPAHAIQRRSHRERLPDDTTAAGPSPAAASSSA